MVWRRAVRCLGALALAAAGCAEPIPRPVDFSEGRGGFDSSSYEQVLATWTRHAKEWKTDIGTVIEVWSVLKSSQFRQAYVERYSKIYSLPEAERRSLYTAQMDAARTTFEFHVTAETTNYKWNDLERASSPWKVTLVDGTGAELAPKQIEVPRLPELYETQFFPNRTAFSRSYVIRFDRAEAEAAGFAGLRSGRLILRVVSPLARVDLLWQSQ
jgi:hypothetical protein